MFELGDCVRNTVDVVEGGSIDNKRFTQGKNLGTIPENHAAHIHINSPMISSLCSRPSFSSYSRNSPNI